MIAGLVGAHSARDCRQASDNLEKALTCPGGMLHERPVMDQVWRSSCATWSCCYPCSD